MQGVPPVSPPRPRGGARKALQAAALSRVLATVTHEIRTPLSGIVGLADLLAGTDATPEQRSYIEAIRASGLALASLVDELLDVSRIEAGKVDLADEPVDVAALVEGVVELLAPRAQGKGLEIASFVAADVPPLIFGDAGRLRQVLLNLAGNAVKFTARGGVGLDVRVAAGRLSIRVSDTGPGVPADRHATIFEPFERVDGASSAAAGTGLGLTISRRLVARMGGRLDIEDSSAAGTTFRADLPLRAAAPAPRPCAALVGLSALITGADAFGPAFLQRILEDGGAAAARVADPAGALARLAEGPVPDLLIVDGAFGSSAAQALAVAARDAGVARSLILVSPYERRAFGPLIVGGYDGWLVKPVRPRSLFARIAARLEAGAAPEPRSFRALVADDDPVNALLATRHLQRLGAAVTCVGDGAAAVAAVQTASTEARAFEIVLLDLHMPGLDGAAVAREIVRIAGAPRRLLAMTAHADVRESAAARAAGFDDILTKPLDLGQIGRALERG